MMSAHLQEPIKKTYRRFKPLPYQPIYLHQESTEFRTAIRDVYESVFKDYLDHQKEGHFAKCCGTFERRELKNKLSHPQDQIIKVSSIINITGIKNIRHLETYLKKTLPRNEDDLILMPTVNRIHSLLTVNSEPLLIDQPKPIQTFASKKSDLSENESSLQLTYGASNQFKAPQDEHDDQFDSEIEDIKQLTINDID